MRSISSLNKNLSAIFVSFFFIALCIFSVIFSIYLSQISLQDKQNLAQISRFEVLNFQYYKFSKEGISILATGELAKENQNKEYELQALNIISLNKEEQKSQNPLENKALQESLNAPFALYNNESVIFPQGVTYNKDSLQFWTQDAEYFPNNKGLEGKGEFVIINGKSKIRGQNIAYKNGKIHATNIRGILRE